MALLKIGEQAITSIDDDSKNASHCKRFWDITVDTVLRLHPWNCATKEAELAELTETPAFGFDHQYQLPADCLRVLSMEDSVYDKFIVEGKKLLTDETTCKIKYIKRITDTTEFDALLVDVIALSLAKRLAFPLAGSRQLVESLTQEFEAILQDAKTTDAMEANYEPEEYSEWVDARY